MSAKCERTCGFCAHATGGVCINGVNKHGVGDEPVRVFFMGDYADFFSKPESPPTTDKASFEEIGRSIGALVARKNAAYGDAVNATAEYLRWLFPDGIPVDRYHDVGLLVRVGDKLRRIANGDNGEESAYLDLAGYGILGAAGHNRR